MSQSAGGLEAQHLDALSANSHNNETTTARTLFYEKSRHALHAARSGQAGDKQDSIDQLQLLSRVSPSSSIKTAIDGLIQQLHDHPTGQPLPIDRQSSMLANAFQQNKAAFSAAGHAAVHVSLSKKATALQSKKVGQADRILTQHDNQREKTTSEGPFKRLFQWLKSM